MATASSVSVDLTTCPICLDLFDSPKSLPCLHAFCLKCLQDHFKSRSPGDKASCPTCRKEFCIPPDGVGGLQHHFIVQQLVDQERERIRLQERCCNEHSDELVKLYCHDCNENICLMCSAVKHRNHHSGELPEVADNCRLTIVEDDKQIQSAISSVHKQSDQTKQDVTKLLRNIEVIKNKVLAIGGAVKRSVDSQINDIFMELQSVTSESVTQAKSARETYQMVLASLESIHTYSEELLDKGRPSDITLAASELHDRARELLLDSDITAVKYQPFHVTFTPADTTQLNLIGKLTMRTKEQSGMSHLLLSLCHLYYAMLYSFQTVYLLYSGGRAVLVVSD